MSAQDTQRRASWTKSQLDSLQRELDALTVAGQLSTQASMILEDFLAGAASPSEKDELDEHEELWNRIEAAWPQLAEAMLSRLREILGSNSQAKCTKQVLSPRENIFD
jgi:hypothetical protein